MPNIVTTLARDTAFNLGRFVTQNLTHGADHLIVLLDEPNPEFQTSHAEHPNVTTFVLDRSFWGGDQPEFLNQRQRIAANLGHTACLLLGEVTWSFYLDADEVMWIDRDVLATVATDVRSVRLKPLESLCGGSPDEFKSLQKKPALRKMSQAGVIDRPNNASLFRGHVDGKTGVRPSWDVRVGIHGVHDANGEKIPAFEHPSLLHLHYESPTLDEFRRKMTNLVRSNPLPAMRESRLRLAREFERLVMNAADSRAASEGVQTLFDTYVADKVDELRAWGVVRTVDVDHAQSTPRSLEPARKVLLDRILKELATVDKSLFRPATPISELRAATEGLLDR